MSGVWVWGQYEAEWGKAFGECMLEKRPVCIFDHPLFDGRFFLNGAKGLP